MSQMRAILFIVINVVILFTGVHCLPFNESIALGHSNVTIAAAHQEDFFAPVSKKLRRPDISMYFVKNIEEISKNYLHVLNNDKNENVIFIIKETKTFLGRRLKEDSSKLRQDPESYGIVENIDRVDSTIGIAKIRNPFKGTTKEKVSKEPKKVDSGDSDDWVEFTYEDVEDREYAGYIPISSCQSQEYGKNGSVTFSYSFSNTVSSTKGFRGRVGVSFAIFALSLSRTLGVSLSTATTIDGETECAIKTGYIGQVLLKPKYISCHPKSRGAKWNRAAKKFLTDTDFRTYDKVYVLLEKDTLQIDCATSDVVDLFCNGYKLGEPNWDSPLGVDYENKIYRNASALL